MPTDAMRRVMFCLLLILITTVSSASASSMVDDADALADSTWGERVQWPDVTTRYPVFARHERYATQPLLITDMREGAAYEAHQSFEMRTATIYRAEGARGLLENQPVVFFVHGGAWIDGYADWYDFVAQSFTGDKGWVTVVVDYRLTSDEVFLADEHCPDRVTCAEAEHVAQRTKAAWYDDNIQDVDLALRWVLAQIDGHGGDADRVVIMGHSAGAHLVSLLVTHPDHAALGQQLLGVISMSGAYDLKMLHLPTFASALGQTFHGGAFDNDAELDEASPLTYLDESTTLPALYLLHAQQELPSLNAQTLAFRDRLAELSIPYDYGYLTGYSHESEMQAIADPDQTPTQLVTDWIDARLIEQYPARAWLPLVLGR